MSALVDLDDGSAAAVIRSLARENQRLEAELRRAREQAPSSCTTWSRRSRGTAGDVLVSIRGRGDAGLLLPRVERIERLLATYSPKDT